MAETFNTVSYAPLPESLGALLKRFRRGVLRIPPWQRDFIWPPDKVTGLKTVI